MCRLGHVLFIGLVRLVTRLARWSAMRVLRMLPRLPRWSTVWMVGMILGFIFVFGL
jgi:hypothetical protein